MRRLVLSLVVVLVGCATDSALKPLSKPLVFGLARPIGETAAQTSASELSTYLAQKIGPGATAQVVEDATQLADALAKGTIDAAWLTPGAYVRARTANPNVLPLVKLLRGGATSYRSVFFTRKDAGASLASFRDKRLALVGKGSMSGHLYPLAYLKKNKIDANSYFGELIEAKDHQEVCQFVASGRADLGATLADDHGTIVAIPDGCIEAGFNADQFAVVAASGSIPNDVIAVRAGIDPDAQARLSHMLEDMSEDPNGRAELKRIFRADGFGRADDHDFDAVRDMESQQVD